MFAWLFSLSVFVLVCFWFRDLPFQIINSMFWITLPPFPILTLFFNSLIRFVHHQFSRVQSLSCVQFFVTPWSAARQATLSITNSKSLLKLMSMELVMPSNHLILCRPLLFSPSIFPSIRVFSKVSSSHQVAWRYWWPQAFGIQGIHGVYIWERQGSTGGLQGASDLLVTCY